MPIINFNFQDRIFFAKELGDISGDEARLWAEQLKVHAQETPIPIVALVDAIDVKHVSLPAINIFATASFTPNVLAVVVAANIITSGTSKNIGLLGKRNQTVVFRTLNEARHHAMTLLGE